MNANIQDKIVQ